MDNHVHFIARGSGENCISFIRLFKKLCSSRLKSVYGERMPMKDADVSIKPIGTAEYLLTAIAYVLRNPLAAGLRVMPGEYRWSSASLYFHGKSFILPGSMKLSELTLKRKRELLKSRIAFPGSYIVEADGLIFPGCYTEYEAVEKIFGTPKQLMFYLSRNNDITIELETDIVRKARYQDIEMSSSLEWICQDRFHGRRFLELSVEQKYMMAKELRRRYACPVSQIARVTSLDPHLLKTML